MAGQNQPTQVYYPHNPQPTPFLPRVWGPGMGQSGMPGMPGMPYNGQQQFPPQMGMPPSYPQMPNQGQPPQQTGKINHPLLDENGNFDFNKVMGHADNINKFINTAKPMMKQLSPLFNMFKGY